jgi:hypothetical protein
MSIEKAAALVSGGYEVERVTVDTRPETTVRLDIRSGAGSATVVLRGVVGLEICQRLSNWPYALAFYDISDRQWDGLAVAVDDGQEDQLRCWCASVDVEMH